MPFLGYYNTEILHSTPINLRNPLHSSQMPAIRHASKRKPPPEGFSDIEDDLLIFSNKMKDAQNTPTDNIPKHQAQWPIFQISHQRSRYIYELYYEKEAISKKLYDWLLKNGYADAMLIAKWKKQGYEKVCARGTPILIYQTLPAEALGGLRDNAGANGRISSCAACDVSRRRRRISKARVSVEYRERNLKKTRTYSVSAAGAEDAPRATEQAHHTGKAWVLHIRIGRASMEFRSLRFCGQARHYP